MCLITVENKNVVRQYITNESFKIQKKNLIIEMCVLFKKTYWRVCINNVVIAIKYLTNYSLKLLQENLKLTLDFGRYAEISELICEGQ